MLNFTFKKYNSESIDDYTSSISIEDYSFSKSMTLNDIIKVFDKKIIFVTTSSDKKILYIISLYNYYENYFLKINMYDLYNHKFYNNIRIEIYKKFLSMVYNC